MSHPTDRPFEEWTAEEKSAFFAEMKRQFTVEDLLQYVNHEDYEKIPAEQVLAKMEEIVRAADLRRAGGSL